MTMRNRIIVCSLICLSAFSVRAADVADYFPPSAHAGQDGSAEHPYEIADEAGLLALRNAVAAGVGTDLCYALTDDVVLTAPWPGIGIPNGKDLVSGNATKVAEFDAGAFCGVFDGRNHTISGFQMVGVADNPANNGEGLDYCGFFNSVKDATVKNLKIAYAGSLFAVDTTASTKETGATFVGVAKNSILQNLTSLPASVSCSKGFGGIVGFLSGGSIVEDCTNNVNLTSLAPNKAGGIAMITQTGASVTIRRCQNNGTTVGRETEKGGIVGLVLLNTTIEDCTDMASSIPSFFTLRAAYDVTMRGANRGSAAVAPYKVQSGANTVDGLNFATVSDGVAAFVADGALAKDGAYKVMATNAIARFAFTEPGTISFDTALFTPVFDITATDGLELAFATEGTVATYTARNTDLENPPVELPAPAIEWRNAYRGECNRDFNLPLESYTFMGETNTLKLIYAYGVYGEYGLPAQYLSLCQNRFDGWFFVQEEMSGEWRVCQMYDDYMAIDFDGVRLVENTSWLDAEFATWTAEPGWHRFTIVAGDTYGGYGEFWAVSTLPEVSTMPSSISISVDGGEWLPFEDSFAFGDGTAFATGPYCAVSFSVGEHGTRTGGGALSQIVRRGTKVEAPEISPDFGWLFSGWSEDFSEVKSNLIVKAEYVRDESAYDAIGGGDALQSAIDDAEYGATIIVAPGVYSPIDLNGKSIRIVAFDGPENTFIDASLLWESGETNRCASLGTTTNAVLCGFTLLNGNATYGGGAYYGTLEDCVVSNCTARYGGGTYYSSLKRCVVKNNVATFFGGGTYYGTTESTLIAGNTTTNRCGGTYYGTHVNATISANTARFAPGGCFSGTLRNSISYGNTASSGNSNYYNVTNTTCEYSCVYPSQSGTGNINSNPKFVNAAGGDYSLQSSSPCINKGWNSLAVDAKDVLGNIRNRDWRIDMGAYEFQNAFVNKGNHTFYVSASTGADTLEDYRGISWSKPFKTIQAAIDIAHPGDTIIVTNGTYAPITATLNKAIRIESVNGADVTIIDGGNSKRCAVLGTSSSDKATVLSGFTLNRGYVYNGNGGGAIYGTLEDCVISNCRARGNSSTTCYGGGTYYSDAVRCEYRNNSIPYYSGYGGAACYGTLTDSSFAGNSAYYGGGTAYGTISNCVYSSNKATSYNGGGAYYGTLHDCVITNNTAVQYGGGTYYSTAYRCHIEGNSSTSTSTSSSYGGGGSYQGTLENCVIRNNTAYRYGGGTMYSTLRNCLVTGNRTTYSYGMGGGLYSGSSYNSTIYGNTSGTSGGIHLGTAYNSIVWGNAATRLSSCANVSNTTCYCVCTTPQQGEDRGNISADPLFADAAAGDFALAADSPCIDVGLLVQGWNGLDLAGNPRTVGRFPDLGAYEFQSEAGGEVLPETLYVDAENGADGGDGLTAATAMRDLQAAIAAVAYGGTIYVQPGVYHPIDTRNVPIAIIGVAGPESTIIDASPEFNDGALNRCATLGGLGLDGETNSVLSGFTLRNGTGMATMMLPRDSLGGGSLCGILENCVIANCSAQTGGGSYSGWLKNSRLVGNAATGSGGGCYGSIVEGCRIIGNEAENGGGAADCEVIVRSLLARNRASGDGGGAYVSWERWGSCIANSIIAENEAANRGGGLFCGDSIEVNYCTITANKAVSGGGIYAGWTPIAYNSIVWGNTLSDGVSTDNWHSGEADYEYAYAEFVNTCTYPLADYVWSNGSLDDDPLLVRFPDGTWRIPSSSPCIGTGDTLLYSYYDSYWRDEYGLSLTDDFFGNARSQSGQTDMGAIEGGFEGIVVSTSCEGFGNISASVACNPGDSVIVDVSQRDDIHMLSGIFVNGEDAFDFGSDAIIDIYEDDGGWRLELMPEENVAVAAVFSTATLHVSPDGDDAASGATWMDAKRTIQGALDASAACDTIVVTNGTYGPISAILDVPLSIISVEGSDETIIDGCGRERCATFGVDTASTKVMLRGFALVNGYAGFGGGAYGGYAVDCVISNCTANYSGGGTYYSNLERCRVVGNHSRSCGGGTYCGTLRSCLVVGNIAANGGGGTYYSTLYNCTVADNGTSSSSSTTSGGGSNYGAAYNSIIWGNSGGAGNHYGTTIHSSCVDYDPQFTTVDGHPYCITISSPCLDAGNNGYVLDSLDLAGNPRIQNGAVDIGCYERTPESGVPLDSISVASGTYTYRGTAWTPGVTVRSGDGTLREGEHYTLAWFDNVNAGEATVVATGTGATFTGSVTNTFAIVPKTLTASMFSLNGAYPFTGEEVRPVPVATESTLAADDWEIAGYADNVAPGTATVTIAAKRNYTGTVTLAFAVSCPELFVSPDGDDSAFGVSADAPKRSIQAAITAAYAGTVIHVAPGTYAPVTTGNKAISVIATEGWEKTIIDGGGTNRCVYVGLNWSNYIPTETNTYFRGFTIRNGYATDSNGCGAGVSGGRFENCVLEGNRVNSNKYGGAAFRAFLYNCLVKNNSGGYGGAADSSSLWSCTVVSNTAINSGGGIYNSHTRNSIIWDNICSAGNSYSNNYNSISATITYSCIGGGASGTGNTSPDPRFVDAANGDYRLLDHSPCIDAASASYVVGDTDLLGNPRIVGAAPDMGCYEGAVELPLPATPSGFEAADGRKIGFVRLSWNAADWAWSYRVERASESESGVWTALGTTDALFFDDQTAVPGTVYWYRVRGVNPEGEGEPSSADSGSCLAEFVIAEPSFEAATAGIPFTATLSATGGAGGYVWRTGADDYTIAGGDSSYAPGDRSSIGVSGDDVCKVWPLPFDFPFYGRTYNKVWVSSNGTLMFDSSLTQTAYSLETFNARPMIAVMWKDIITGSAGIEVATNGTDSITFYWNAARYYSGGAAVNFSATLFADGTVVCSYGDGNANGGFVGVSAGDGARSRYIDLQGTSMGGADDIVFRPQDLPAGLSIAPDGTISGTPTEEGEFSFTAFVSDALGNGASRIVTITVENNPNMRRVDFVMGEHGARVGGGALAQGVMLGDAAVAPTLRAASGWVFDGWDNDFSDIQDNMTVTALWRPAKPALRVADVAAPESAKSGDAVEVSWTLSNWGNAEFNGTMTEEVWLVSADGAATNTVASVSFSGVVARDGTAARSASFTLPRKGLEGVWRVVVVSALKPSVLLHATGVSGAGQGTLTISAIPLPDLTAESVTLSPSSLVPGGTATIEYAVRNDGAADADGAWVDSVWLVSDASGAETKLADIQRSGPLAAGAVRAESAEIAIPETVALAGDVRAKVVADAGDSVVEQDDANNAAVSATAATLPARLALSAASASLAENGQSVRFTVKRSGPRDAALAVALAASPDGQLTLPETVTISAGSATASFTARTIDNSVVDGPRAVEVSASADGFVAVSASVTVTDNETPHLYLSLSGEAVREGGTLSGAVRRELVADSALTVYLSGPSSSRCAYPSSVTIPAGETGAAFEIAVPDNATAQRDETYTLRASASGHTAATAAFTVEDDDVPGFTLALSPEIVSESAGANAVYATLTRIDQDQIASDVRVRLSQTPAGNLILPSTITIPKYTMAVRFAIGTVDNALDDGDRDVTIDGAVVIESCGCDGQPSTGDAIRAVLTVIDDDGPALSLKAEPATMKEGLEEAGFLVLSHNSALAEDLEVALSFDVEGEIDIPATATIPAGAASVRFPVRTLDDGEEDGAKLVSVYAEEVGRAVSGEPKPVITFAPASTWLQVSDQNLPDLSVSEVAVPASVVAMERFAVSFVVTNSGFMARSGAVPYAVHLVRGATSMAVSSATLAASGSLTGGIAVDGVLAGEAVLAAPEISGDFRVAVVIDPDGSISELDVANNTGWSAAFSVNPAYAAEVAADADAYLPGETITITGVATLAGGAPAALVPVDVYLLRDSYRKTLSATTDSTGAFTVAYTPSSGECGHYRIGACYPGEGSAAEQDEFDVMGMKRTSTANVIWDYALGDSATRTVTLKNLSAAPLTGLAARFEGVPEGCSLEYTLPDTIPGNGTVTLSMTATAVGLTEGSDYEKFRVYLETEEGVGLDFPLYFHSQTQQACLRATPTSINTTMTVGAERTIAVTIYNDGKGDSGPVTVATPSASWIRVASAAIDNLESGESATVALLFTPPESLVLNSPYNGTIVVSCQNGNSVTISFRIVPVSSETGGIRIDATDTLTLTSENSPHLEGAFVSVVNPGTGAVVASGTTGLDGIFECDGIPAGKYNVSISAPQHSSANMTISVSPGVVTRQAVFLDYNSINYVWKVVPTEVEDQYTIELVAEYETNVPVPAMQIHVPDEIPDLAEGESYVCGVEIENTGLIAIVDVKLALSGSIGNWTYEQISPDIKSLPAKSSQTIYVKFTNPAPVTPVRRSAAAARAGATSGLTEDQLAEVAPCTIGMIATARALCGEEGVDLLMRSPNIRVAGHLCDMAALMFQELGKILERWGIGGGGGGSDPERNPNPGTHPQEPVIRDPIEVEMPDVDCACLLTVLDRFLGLTLFRYINAENIMDGAEKMSHATNICSFVENAAEVKWNGLVGPKSLEDHFDSAFDIYEACKDSFGENRWMEIGAGAYDIYKKLKKLWKAIKKTNNAAQNMFKGEKWENGDNMQTIWDFLDEYFDKHEDGPPPTWNDFVEFSREKMTGWKEEDYDEFVASWNRIIDNIRKEKKNESSGQQTRQSLAKSASARGMSAEEDEEVEPINPAVIEEALEAYAELRDELESSGYSLVGEMLDRLSEDIQAMMEGANALALCSKVRFKLSQSVTMTREAFEGTLTLENGQLTGSLSDVRLVPSITDAEGNVCNDLFGVTDKDHSGFGGTSFLNGDLTLGTGEKGVASVLFVATQQAAPTVAKIYYFGGVLSYFDDIRGERISVNLVPVPLQVNPSPYLKFDYFVQRDVYADDPFTEDVVEASMPAELSVLIRNAGAGDAKNVTIQSMQPEVVENEKGLAVAFSMSNYGDISSALNGRTAYLGALEDVHLGTIGAGESSVAQWWLSSSIEGHFIGINASVTQANTWGNPDTSLIDSSVGTHKLVRSIVADGDALPDFLTSEEGDLYGRPDTIYTAAGEVLEVHAGTARPEGSPHLVGPEVALSVTLTPARSGWNYAELALPGLFRYTIAKIERADGTEVPLRNAWITDRTFRDGLTPLLVEKLHIVDEFASNGAAAYTVTLAAKPTDGPEVVAFEGISNGAVESAARDAVTVVFSTAVDPATFSDADLSLVHQGAFVADLPGLAVAPETGDETGTRFTISGLAAVCGDPGRNELTVQCAGIANLSGSFGTAGRSVAWTYSAADAPYIIGIDGVPRRAVQSLDAVTVVLSTAVDPASFTAAALRLDGAAVGAGVTVRALDDGGTRFAISGLAAAQGADGEHTLSVDATALVSLDGEAGVAGGGNVATWTRDTVAPRIVAVEREETLGGTRFVVRFSEEVEEGDVTLDRFALVQNAENGEQTDLFAANAAHLQAKTVRSEQIRVLSQVNMTLPETATLENLGGGVWALSGVDSALSADGAYTLTFTADGVADEAGNEAEGSSSVSWTQDTTPPAGVEDLRISPDLGSSASDGLTGEASVTVLGTLPDDAAAVSISVRYATGSETALVAAFAPETTALAVPLTIPGTGNMTLVVTCADEAGNESETTMAIYLDALALTATLSGAPADETELPGDITLAFSDAVDASGVSLAKFALTRDGAAVPLSGATLTAGGDGGSSATFTLSGLGALCAEDGLYRLVFDGSAVRKTLSGLAMESAAATVSAEWTRLAPDREAPRVVSVAIDGEGRNGTFFDTVTTIDVAFSEAVNITELAADGWIGQAVKLSRLGADGEPEAVVLALAEEISWNGETATMRWTLPSGVVGPGDWRLALDAGFIADAAGNALAADGADATLGGLVRFDADAAVAVRVNSYAMPSFGDFDGDGAPDLLVGEKSADGLGRIRLFRNAGLTASGTPVLSSAGTLAAGGEEIAISAQGCQGASAALLPRFGSDAADLVVGDAFGKVWLYPAENEGWGEGTVLIDGTDEEFGSARAVVAACDLAGSGRASLVVGGMDGKFRSYIGMWRGTLPESGNFDIDWLCSADDIPLAVFAGRSAPATFDLNGDGLPDLLSGDTVGNVWAFLGDGRYSWNAIPVQLLAAGALPDRSRIAVADLAGNGDPVLAVGRSDGSVRMHVGEAAVSPSFLFAVTRTPPTLAEALDAPTLAWTTGESGTEWFGAWTGTGDGALNDNAARATADGAWLETEFNGAGRISFRVRVQTGCGAVAFAIDGAVVAQIGDEALRPVEGPYQMTDGEWNEIEFVLASGSHEARWTWTAPEGESGEALPMLDGVEWTPAPWTESETAAAAAEEFREFLVEHELLAADGGEESFVAASLADEDGDGQSAWAEFVAMTDPTKPDDVFTATIEMGADGVPVVEWNPDRPTERDYELQSSERVTGPWETVSDPGDGSDQTRFYRVKVLLK